MRFAVLLYLIQRVFGKKYTEGKNPGKNPGKNQCKNKSNAKIFPYHKL